MRRFVLFGVVVASLVLLPNAMGVAQDGENVLLHEDFEGKEKKDTWEVLESDVGNGYGVTKGFLNAFGALSERLGRSIGSSGCRLPNSCRQVVWLVPCSLSLDTGLIEARMIRVSW